MKFLVDCLTAYRVNLLMNDYACGLPSPLAFLGLGAAIAPAVGATRWSVGVLPVLHAVEVSQGRTKPEMAPKSGVFTPVEIVEDMTGMVQFSLVLDIPNCASELAVADALQGRRLAGGIFEGEIRVATVQSDGGALRHVKRGWAMLRPDSADLRRISTGDEESLAAIAERLAPAAGAGWLVPLAVGHFLLEDPARVAKRKGVRDPTLPHVFTEPVLGIGELVSVRNRKLTEAPPEQFDELFWRWHAQGDWVLGHRAYHPSQLIPV